jgi:biotin-dependent carboxylase-like uncharacterized protein
MSDAPSLEVIDPGPQATLQDAGRYGYQRFGVTPAGAIDAVSHRAANALVGNPPTAGVIEFAMVGGEYLCAAESARVAVTGGSFGVSLDGRPQGAWRTITLARGQRLRIGRAENAARGYLAVAGGFQVEPVLGSVSTHARSGIGGHAGGVEGGRALASGDRLRLAQARAPDGPDRAIDPQEILARRRLPVRVVLGPQDDHFTPEGIATLLSGSYTVTQEADRMGYRLAGPEIAHRAGYNIISDGVAIGSVQVPGSRQPIVLLADRQSTGGYPKIATVIGPDLPTLAQLPPGATIRFEAVDLDQAHAAAVDHRRFLDALPGKVHPMSLRPQDLTSEHLLAANLIDGVVAGHDD